MKKYQQSNSHHLDFFDISLETPQRRILHSISGSFNTGDMIAFMGTSGSGKTSLLNSLAGRLPSNLKISGSIRINGCCRDPNTWANVIGYVEQFFYSYENQTVEETLLFYIKLNHINSNENNNKHSIEDPNDNIFLDDLISILNLSNVRNTMISMLSGGEKKRLSIGAELISKPSILFLDEPLSGLDSYNAIRILEVLSKLKSSGISVIMTIHQPSSQMMEYFDSLLIIEAGRVVYDGTYANCIEYFSKLGYECPPMTNPLDFYIDRISDSERKIPGKMNQEWIKYKIEKKEKSILTDNYKNNNENFTVTYGFFYKTMISLILLFKRNCINLRRSPGYLTIQLIQKTIFALILGLTFLRLGDSKESTQSRVGAINFLILNSLFGVIGPILNVFAAEKRVVLRERRTGLYSGGAAYYAKYLSEILLVLLINFFYLTTVYWLIGICDSMSAYLTFLAIQATLLSFSVAYAFTISALSPTQAVSQIIGSTLIIFFVIYGGFYSNQSTIPVYLRWIVWISPVNYAFRASMVALVNPKIVDQFGVSGVGILPCIAVLWGFIVFVTIIGAVGLHNISKINIKGA